MSRPDYSNNFYFDPFMAENAMRATAINSQLNAGKHVFGLARADYDNSWFEIDEVRPSLPVPEARPKNGAAWQPIYGYKILEQNN